MHIEYAPKYPSHHLGDKTRIDALIEVDGEDGKDLLVVECKYADRFNSRRLNIADNSRYPRLVAETGIWTSETVLNNATVNQLIRCHALGASLARANQSTSVPTMLLIHHDSDISAAGIADAYRSVLTDKASFRATTLASFLAAMDETARGQEARQIAAALQRRYDNLSWSEPAWEAWTGAQAADRVSLTVGGGD